MKNSKNFLLKLITTATLLTVGTISVYWHLTKSPFLDIITVKINQFVYPGDLSRPRTLKDPTRWGCAEIALYNALLSEKHPEIYNHGENNLASLDKKILFKELVEKVNSAIGKATLVTDRPQGSCKTLAKIAEIVGINMHFLSLTNQNIAIDREGINTETTENLSKKIKGKMTKFILSPAQQIHFLCFIFYPGGEIDPNHSNHGFLITINKNKTMYVYEDGYTRDKQSAVQSQIQAFIKQLTGAYRTAIAKTKPKASELNIYSKAKNLLFPAKTQQSGA